MLQTGSSPGSPRLIVATAVVLGWIAIKQNFGKKAEEPKLNSLDKS
jgi:hypothetical protein